MSEAPNLTPVEPGAATPQQAGTADKLASLVASNVETVLAGLEGLTADDLEQLRTLEQAGKARVTVLGAVQRLLDALDKDPDLTVTAPGEGAVPNVTGNVTDYSRMRACDVDNTTIRTPVLTLDGWLMPAVSAHAQG